MELLGVKVSLVPLPEQRHQRQRAVAVLDGSPQRPVKTARLPDVPVDIGVDPVLGGDEIRLQKDGAVRRHDELRPAGNDRAVQKGILLRVVRHAYGVWRGNRPLSVLPPGLEDHRAVEGNEGGQLVLQQQAAQLLVAGGIVNAGDHLGEELPFIVEQRGTHRRGNSFLGIGK